MTRAPRRGAFALLFLGCLGLAPSADAGWREVAVSDHQLHTIRAIDGEVYVGGARIGRRDNARVLTASVILKFDGRAWAPIYEAPFKGRFWALIEQTIAAAGWRMVT